MTAETLPTILTTLAVDEVTKAGGKTVKDIAARLDTTRELLEATQAARDAEPGKTIWSFTVRGVLITAARTFRNQQWSIIVQVNQNEYHRQAKEAHN